MYRWVDHTGELEIEIESATEEGVFAEALAAMSDLMGRDDEEPLGPSGEPVEREIALDAPDRAGLLAGWLDELVFLAETESFVPDSVEALMLGEGRLRARVRGHAGDPPHLVKAVTYHRLAFERSGPGWRAGAVLDV